MLLLYMSSSFIIKCSNFLLLGITWVLAALGEVYDKYSNKKMMSAENLDYLPEVLKKVTHFSSNKE